MTSGWHCGFICKPTEQLVWSALKTLKKSQIPPRKAWKTKLWKLEQRLLKRDFKSAGVVILFPVIHIYWAKGEWWLSGDCSTSVAQQMNEDANRGRGKLKPLVTLSTPQRPWCRTLSLSTSRTQPLCLSVPLASITSRPSTFSSRQTPDALCWAEPMRRDRCALLRESSLISCLSTTY